MSEAIKRLNPSTLPDAGAMGYSQISIVEPGRMAYISGQVAWLPNGEPVPDSLVEQAKIVVVNCKAALDSINAKPEHIVIARCFVTDLNPLTLEQVFPILLELFEGTKPSLTGVGVAALASPELKIEVELTVRLPD